MGERQPIEGNQYCRCFTNGDRCLPHASRGIQCCQPSKSCKNWWVGNTAFAEELSDSSVVSVKSVVIGAIDWLSGTIGGIVEVPDTFSVTDSKVGICYPVTWATNRKVRIESYCHWLQSVTECPRLSINLLDKQLQWMNWKGLHSKILFFISDFWKCMFILSSSCPGQSTVFQSFLQLSSIR